MTALRCSRTTVRTAAALVTLWTAALTQAPAPAEAGFGARPAAEAPPFLRLRVLDTSQRSLLRTGRLPVTVRVSRAARVSLSAGYFRSAGPRVLLRLARPATVRFARGGTRTIPLRLTAAGRRLLASCAGARITVEGRATGLPRRRPRRRPSFTGKERLATTTVTLRLDAAHCRVEPSEVRAGAASTDITPPVGTPMFAYTARSGLANPENTAEIALQLVADPDSGLYAKTFVASRGIHTRVRARAIVLETAAGKFALVQADLGGIPYAMVQEVARRIEGTGIPPERILISATHTHSSTGPIWPTDSQGYALLGGDAFDARIFALTAEGIATSITTADARLAPARVGVGTSTVQGASRNRSKDAFGRNPDVPSSQAEREAASINPDLTVIRVDAADGRPLGVWSNFAIHPTSFGDENLLFSGDNPAFAERIAEEAIGRDAERRGVPTRSDRPVVNVWTNSSEGDISPNGDPDRAGGEALQYVPNRFASAHLAGARVGEGIVRAWRDAGRNMKGSLALDARRTFVDFNGTPADGEPVGPVPVLGFGGIVGPTGTCSPVEGAAGPGQGRKLPLLFGPGLVPQVGPVSVWRVGSLGIAAFPAEITKQMGLRLANGVRDRSAGALERVTIAGLTNGYLSYTATPEEYDGCAYEGSFTLWGRRQGPRYLDVAVPLAGSIFGGGPPPAGAAEPLPLALGPAVGTEPSATPEAGRAATQPAPVVRRLGQAVFAWQGGHPSIDAPRGRPFVSLQRRGEDGEWATVATDDSFFDTTERSPEDLWSERFQFDECAPTGLHRFLVTGRADRGAGGPVPYELSSAPFRVEVASIKAAEPVVAGGRASVTATYPDPGKEILLALPRRVRSGHAVLDVTHRGRTTRVRAGLDPARLAFVADVPAGAGVRVVEVRDGCGNHGR